MTVQSVKDMQTPIGDLLPAADAGGVLVHAQGELPYALIPLDDDLIDFLIERNPTFIEECRQIRQRMQNAKSRTHEEVKELFDREAT